MDLVGQANWDAFRNLMRDAHDTFAQKDIIWNRLVTQQDRWGEDTGTLMVPIALKCLCNYNYMRTWPITQGTDAGKLDRSSVQILLNKDYLRDLGYLNEDGYFDFGRNEDTFILDGITYRDFGDTAISQAHDDDLWFAIILKREEEST